MTSFDSMPHSKEKSTAIANSHGLTVSDASSLIDMLLSIRVTAATTSNLANHMKREGVEDFADSLVEDIDFRLEALVATLLSRSSSEASAAVARIESVIGEVRRHD